MFKKLWNPPPTETDLGRTFDLRFIQGLLFVLFVGERWKISLCVNVSIIARLILLIL